MRVPLLFFLKFLIPCFVFLLSALEAKVMIYAHYFGQPEFIKYQHQLFKKNMLDEYEFVVFEDARDSTVSLAIQHECSKYGIRYIHISRDVFDNPKFPLNPLVNKNSASFECSVATQYIYDNYVVPSKDICMILDNDIFLLSSFCVESYLNDSAFSYVLQVRGTGDNSVSYMLPNFLIFNSAILPEREQLSFNMGQILGNDTDSGGYSYFYLRNHMSIGKPISMYYLWEISPAVSTLKALFNEKCPLLFNSQEWSSHFFIQNDSFLHIRMGSNWSNHPNYKKMMQEVTSCFDELLLE